jgi:hypothetical protein
MEDRNDFSLEDPSDLTGGETAPRVPVVPAAVGRSRRRSFALLPPLLILTTAGMALAYRVQLSDWTGLNPLLTGTQRPAARRVVRPAPAAAPVIVRVVPAPVLIPIVPLDFPTAGLITDLSLLGPVPDATLRRPRLARAAIGFDRPQGPLARAASSRGRAGAEAPPEALTKTALAAIRKEAALRRAEIARLERIKANQPENDRRRAQLIRTQQLDRARRLANATRARFLEDLADILHTAGRRSATKIYAYIEPDLVDIEQGVSDELAKALRRLEGRIDRRQRIALFRSYGIPEPLILEYLWKHERRRIPQRGGPRDEAEALVRAANQLLALGPSPVRKGSASAPSRRNEPTRAVYPK